MDKSPSKKLTNLWTLPVLRSAKVISDRQLSPSVKMRMTELGFGVGAEVKCVEALPFSGPRCFLTTRGEFALDQEVLEQIECEVIDRGDSK